MNAFTFLPVNEEILKTFLESEPDILKDLSKERSDGIDDKNFAINTFKVEQKIIQLTSNNSLNIGGFVNGKANISDLKVRYLLVLFSNQFKVIKDSLGNVIRKRFGVGVGFTLNVSNIETKIGINFRALAATSALNLAKIDYEIEVSGVNDPSLAQYMPDKTGSFDSNVYKKLQVFVSHARDYLKGVPIDRFYPIEILNQIPLNSENADVESIYYGALKIAEGESLKWAIENLRSKNYRINENIVQFMYGYFDIKDAYTKPDAKQITNARDWTVGRYNKIIQTGTNDMSWVAIDPTIEDGKFVALSHLQNPGDYQPHPKPLNWSSSGLELKEIFSEISLDFSSSVKLSSIINASGKFNTRTITRDIVLYADIDNNRPIGSKIIETRYGVGIRLIVHISNVEFGTKIDYSTIGASSELNLMNVEFEISGFGFNDTTLVDILPGPQDITQETMSKIDDAFNKIKNNLAVIDRSKLDPQAFMIRVNEPEKVDPTLDAQAVVYAYQQINEKKSLNDAIKNLPPTIDKTIIVNTYKNRFNIDNPGVTPSRDLRNKASDWIHI